MYKVASVYNNNAFLYNKAIIEYSIFYLKNLVELNKLLLSIKTIYYKLICEL